MNGKVRDVRGRYRIARKALADLDVVTCVECEREFDLMNETDANEWFYGHDCEA